MIDTSTPRPTREPRTFELREAEWVEEPRPGLQRPPFWVRAAFAFAALIGFVLIAFAAVAGLATLGLMRIRAGVMRLFGR
jgi:hypothetical protein